VSEMERIKRLMLLVAPITVLAVAFAGRNWP
jgi:hypothetical protein